VVQGLALEQDWHPIAFTTGTITSGEWFMTMGLIMTGMRTTTLLIMKRMNVWMVAHHSPTVNGDSVSAMQILPRPGASAPALQTHSHSVPLEPA